MLGFVPATRFEESPDLEMRFPPLPRTVTEVSRLLSEHNDIPDTERLTEIVEIDPVIVSAVLRRINSAYYGLRRLIADIHKAVFLLGFLEVSNIVLTEGMMKLKSVVQTEEQEKMFSDIMRLSLAAADLAQELAFQLKLPARNSAFTAGLLHGVGRLVLLYNKPHDYEALWWTNDIGTAPSTEDERTIFGTDHARLNGLAADKWHLPEELARVLEYYPAPQFLPPGATQDLAGVLNLSVAAAEQLCHACNSEGQFTFEPPEATQLLARQTGARPSDLKQWIEARIPDTISFVNEAMGHF